MPWWKNLEGIKLVEKDDDIDGSLMDNWHGRLCTVKACLFVCFISLFQFVCLVFSVMQYGSIIVS